MGMGGARLDSLRILAGVGPVSGGAREFRLARRRRSRDVERAAQLHGILGALEQELQFRQPLRPVVPEPVPARKFLRVQLRWIPHAEFHSDAGHDDPGPDRRALVARLPAEHSDEKVADCRRDGDCAGTGAALFGHLPSGETHLDAVVDHLQRRRLLLVPGRFQLGDRCEGFQEMGVPAGCRRHELDCCVLHRAFHGRISG